MRVELTRRNSVSGQIHTRCACGRVGDCSGSGLLPQCHLALTGPHLVPGSTSFGGIYVQQPSLPRVSLRFFESSTYGGTLWP